VGAAAECRDLAAEVRDGQVLAQSRVARLPAARLDTFCAIIPADFKAAVARAPETLPA
jgi:hypothetical protein